MSDSNGTSGAASAPEKAPNTVVEVKLDASALIETLGEVLLELRSLNEKVDRELLRMKLSRPG